MIFQRIIEVKLYSIVVISLFKRMFDPLRSLNRPLPNPILLFPLRQ